ncbi:hypothetical protein BUALT_Bualt02G0203000 [Buddleja alternifolia]|uniref:CRIB domain-containing protein n=1 Tax=Buddleja alternifolia TaxID=168488 RepID=A0AAV6Y3X6_9LAMI|nr:hypothetical protein BUALT_Bualt02G0203000 [Buddleja alternifolia]
MATKMKGLFKGLRYISHIFEEEKEDDIQIGFPTDVKHVAHIGWDGPTVHESPSWMKEFNSSSSLKSAPLGPPPGEPREDPEIKWVSEDSKRGLRATDSPGRDLPEVPKSSRRHNSAESNPNDSPRKKDSSSKSRHSRKHHSKDKDLSEGSVKSGRKTQESGPSSNLPDIPKKSRRKKSKESVNGGGSSRGKSTKGDNDPTGESGGGSSRGKSKRASKYSDPGIDNESLEQIPGSQSGHIPSILDREEK